ncbi:MAG: hypothetical protein MUC29_01550 [Pyrinomonadaceae bacterium]|jgi:hypothetical protein|nr:hypothetical protein [Pyrinomonadaceae bacterium]
MKTAISVSDEIFELSERLAKQLKVSRSKIFAMGVEKLGKELSKNDLKDKINAVCEEVDTSVESTIRKYQNRQIMRDEW